MTTPPPTEESASESRSLSRSSTLSITTTTPKDDDPSLWSTTSNQDGGSQWPNSDAGSPSSSNPSLLSGVDQPSFTFSFGSFTPMARTSIGNAPTTGTPAIGGGNGSAPSNPAGHAIGSSSTNDPTVNGTGGPSSSSPATQPPTSSAEIKPSSPPSHSNGTTSDLKPPVANSPVSDEGPDSRHTAHCKRFEFRLRDKCELCKAHRQAEDQFSDEKAKQSFIEATLALPHCDLCGCHHAVNSGVHTNDIIGTPFVWLNLFFSGAFVWLRGGFTPACAFLCSCNPGFGSPDFSLLPPLYLLLSSALLCFRITFTSYLVCWTVIVTEITSFISVWLKDRCTTFYVYLHPLLSTPIFRFLISRFPDIRLTLTTYITTSSVFLSLKGRFAGFYDLLLKLFSTFNFLISISWQDIGVYITASFFLVRLKQWYATVRTSLPKISIDFKFPWINDFWLTYITASFVFVRLKQWYATVRTSLPKISIDFKFPWFSDSWRTYITTSFAFVRFKEWYAIVHTSLPKISIDFKFPWINDFWLTYITTSVTFVWLSRIYLTFRAFLRKNLLPVILSISGSWRLIIGMTFGDIGVETNVVLFSLFSFFIAILAFFVWPHLLVILPGGRGPHIPNVPKSVSKKGILVGGLILGTSYMAHVALKMEHQARVHSGYETPLNWIIPKPTDRFLASNESLEYVTDLVHFRHSCGWHAPRFDAAANEVAIGGEKFGFRQFSRAGKLQNDETACGSGIFSLGHPDSGRGVSALLIFGGNSTLPFKGDPHCRSSSRPNVLGQSAMENTINLDHMTASYEAAWHQFSTSRFRKFNGDPLVFRAPLAIALLCDAHAALHTGRVRLAFNRITVKSSDISPRVGNIDPTELPRFFSYALDGLNDPTTHVLANDATGAASPLLVEFNPLAERLLFASTVKRAEWKNASLAPLPLDDIATNVDAFVSSVSKVQRIDGANLDIEERYLFNGTGPMEVDGEIKSIEPCVDPYSDA